MLGTTYALLHRDNPKLDKLLVDSMLGMCAQMMTMAVALLAPAEGQELGRVAFTLAGRAHEHVRGPEVNAFLCLIWTET